jgi:deoxycytidine triphosphate deaminase
MTVLGAEKIKQKIDTLFETGTYNEDNIGSASYDLRLGEDEFLIDGKVIDEKVRYIDLPPRKLSQLSTMEILKLPKDICATVGITFSVSQLGLIPSFGPEVDPGYEGRFYGVVYNLTSKPIRLEVGKKLFKIYFMEVQGESVKINHKPLEISRLDKIPITILEHTKDDSVGEVIQNIENIRLNIKKIESKISVLRGRINSVEGGYKQVTYFGIFLIAATILGISASVVLTLLFSQTAPRIDKYLTAIVIIVFLLVFVYLFKRVFDSIKKDETNKREEII